MYCNSLTSRCCCCCVCFWHVLLCAALPCCFTGGVFCHANHPHHHYHRHTTTTTTTHTPLPGPRLMHNLVKVCHGSGMRALHEENLWRLSNFVFLHPCQGKEWGWGKAGKGCGVGSRMNVGVI